MNSRRMYQLRESLTHFRHRLTHAASAATVVADGLKRRTKSKFVKAVLIDDLSLREREPSTNNQIAEMLNNEPITASPIAIEAAVLMSTPLVLIGTFPSHLHLHT